MSCCIKLYTPSCISGIRSVPFSYKQTRNTKAYGYWRQNNLFENRELLVGDMFCMITFCGYKQVSSMVFLPDFPGWLAPLQFNPTRFTEFVVFVLTMCATWTASTVVFGGYSRELSRDLSTALKETFMVWLLCMPVVAAQLVLVTASEGRTLVGGDGFAQHLPLAATGVGEPFVTAAGVLGTMAIWRSFYVTYLDRFGFLKLNFTKRRINETQAFTQTLGLIVLVAIMYSIGLEIANRFVGEEQAEAVFQYVTDALG
eukprot:TRINITY_DN44328_c0_g2_i2.p2 TRINITY_DN44328_c0_g2~~TRINITY_DN44328_c0_g2_i2.p2  ORF type:complete len:284 (+),score=19.77 TRINITY_DN44328_c0_g2_i2:84-854(+)